MSDRNTFTMTGRLASDPERGGTQSGKNFVKFSFANGRSWQDKLSQEWQSVTSFFRCTAWGYMAEKVEKLRKGDWALIEGRVEIREYMDKNNEKKRLTEVTVSNITIPPKPKGEQSAPAGELYSHQGTPQDDYPLDFSEFGEASNDGDVSVPF